VCGHDAESYVGVIFAAGTASHTGQVKGDDPNKEEIPVSSKLGGWSVRLSSLTKISLLRSLIMGAGRATLVKEMTGK
jgi:hypothetical protein